MPQTFDPNNVTVLQKPDGTVPDKHSELIIQTIIENSKVMQLGRYEEMEHPTKKFSVFVGGGGAYWINETQKIPTAKAEWKTVEMVAKKLAVIMPVSNEYLRWGMARFFDYMKPYIAERFYKKFDEAVILGQNNPFAQSIARSIATANTNLTGAIGYDKILEMQDKLYEKNMAANAFISTVQNRTALRGAVKNENGVSNALYDRSANTLDGLPVVDLNSDKMPKGTLIAGDFNYLCYGIPQGMEYAISQDAQLSTLVNEDGTPVNLFEQDMSALRVIMHVGCLIVKDEAFSALNMTTDENVFTTMPGHDKANSTDPDAVKNTHKKPDVGG